MKIKSLAPNERNPRRIEKHKLEMLAKSLVEFGSLDGFIYNRTTKRLAGGHQRRIVMPEDAEVIIDHKYEKPTQSGTVAEGHVLFAGEKFPYREVEWDENKEKAANIAANKGAGDWDLSKLQEFVVDLDTANFDLDLTMFDEDELKDLFGDKLEDKEKKEIEDEVPEAPKEPISKLGDIYELGEHRLLCGDSTDKATVERLMNSEKADMVFTDPPYGMNVVKPDGNIGGVRKGSVGWQVGTMVGESKFHKAKVGVYRPIIGDDKPYDPTHLMDLAELKIIWGANHFSDKLPCSPHWIVWNKEMPEGADFSGAELAWTNVDKKAVKVFKFTWAGMTRQGDRKDELIKRVHPTQKPVGLFVDILNHYEPNSVIDVFGGSGSTLIACEKTKRKCFMMELDPHYVDVIVSRWCKYTGKTEIKRNGEPMTWHIAT